MEHMICPECNATAVIIQEWQVQEIDLESLTYQPAELLREYECQECGWSASRVINPLIAAGMDW